MKITHDFHVHTNLSICAKPEATLENYVERWRENGITKVAITDHMWDVGAAPIENDFYEKQNFEHILTLCEKIEEYRKNGLDILFGTECEYSYKTRRPAITPAVAEQMDVLLVPNSHTHLTMPKDFYEPHEKHIEYMIDAFMDIVTSDVAPFITAVPHPFLAVCCPYPNRDLVREMTDDQFKRCFDAAAKAGIALELNPNYIRNRSLEAIYNDPIFRMFRLGKECGCKFTVGSDSHSMPDYDNFHLIYVLTSLLGLKEDDFHPKTR